MQTSSISITCRGPKAHDDTVHEMARDEAHHVPFHQQIFDLLGAKSFPPFFIILAKASR